MATQFHHMNSDNGDDLFASSDEGSTTGDNVEPLEDDGFGSEPQNNEQVNVAVPRAALENVAVTTTATTKPPPSSLPPTAARPPQVAPTPPAAAKPSSILREPAIAPKEKKTTNRVNSWTQIPNKKIDLETQRSALAKKISAKPAVKVDPKPIQGSADVAAEVIGRQRQVAAALRGAQRGNGDSFAAAPTNPPTFAGREQSSTRTDDPLNATSIPNASGKASLKAAPNDRLQPSVQSTEQASRTMDDSMAPIPKKSDKKRKALKDPPTARASTVDSMTIAAPSASFDDVDERPPVAAEAGPKYFSIDSSDDSSTTTNDSTPRKYPKLLAKKQATNMGKKKPPVMSTLKSAAKTPTKKAAAKSAPKEKSPTKQAAAKSAPKEKSPTKKAAAKSAPKEKKNDNGEKRKHPVNTVTYEGPPQKKRKDGWPEGWIEKRSKRSSGKTKDHEDTFFCPPNPEGKEYKLRSLVEVDRFLYALELSGGDYQHAWQQRQKGPRGPDDEPKK